MCDWHIPAIYNVSDRRPIDRKIASVNIPASDPLPDAIVVFVFSVGYDNCVGWSLDLKNLLWYWHGSPL